MSDTTGRARARWGIVATAVEKDVVRSLGMAFGSNAVLKGDEK